MTTEVKKSLRAAAGVLTCIAAIAGGAIWRDRVELGDADRPNLANLVASTSARTELPETKFFEDMMELLKRKYVDPIGDDSKLADGAVRGMIASLGDPNSLYMDANQYRVYNNARSGKYEGIGADLVLERGKRQEQVQTGGPNDSVDSTTRLPRLVIAAIVPGSSADKAGLKAGDWAEFVDEHWIPNSEAFDEFEKLSQKVKDHTASAEEFLKMRKLLRDEAEKNIPPIKARDRLMIGTAGVVKTQWMRGPQRIQVELAKGEWQMPGFRVQADGSIRLPFASGSANKLREKLSGKTEATIDLRNNVDGDFDAMLACLKVAAPNGDYGYLVTRKAEKPQTLTVSDGPTRRLDLTLLVDQTTRGAAEIFALALSSRGVAKLSGGATAGNLFVVHWYSLPDGAGYTMVTSEYSTNAPTGILAKHVETTNSIITPKGTPNAGQARRETAQWNPKLNSFGVQPATGGHK